VVYIYSKCYVLEMAKSDKLVRLGNYFKSSRNQKAPGLFIRDIMKFV